MASHSKRNCANRHQAKFDPENGSRCFHCNSYGHMANTCPKKNTVHWIHSDEPKKVYEPVDREPFTLGGKITGWPFNDIVIDTGARRTIVNSRFVLEEAYTGQTVQIWSYEASPRELRLENVTVEVEGRTAALKVGTSDEEA